MMNLLLYMKNYTIVMIQEELVGKWELEGGEIPEPMEAYHKK